MMVVALQIPVDRKVAIGGDVIRDSGTRKFLDDDTKFFSNFLAL